MPEADAEGDTPGSGRPLAMTEGTRLNIEFASRISTAHFFPNEPFPSPAAHSIWKPPRNEMRMESGGGEGRGRVLAPERGTTESNRTSEYKATTRAERARSGVGAKIGSSEIVQTSIAKSKAPPVGVFDCDCFVEVGLEQERGRENILFSRGGRNGKTVGFPEVPVPPLEHRVG